MIASNTQSGTAACCGVVSVADPRLVDRVGRLSPSPSSRGRLLALGVPAEKVTVVRPGSFPFLTRL
jgi:hypothetical protein